MKKKIVRVLVWLLISGMLAAPALAAPSFPDVDENADYAEAVEFLNEIGVMEGDDQGNFNPDKPVSRAEMATIICRMLGEIENLTTGKDFSDVPERHWANKYIAKAAELGIVGGYGNGTFGPGDTVTYEQAVAMIVRVAGQESGAENAGGYPDGHLKVANDNGYLSGLSIKSGEPMMRWHVAVICYNLMMGGNG